MFFIKKLEKSCTKMKKNRALLSASLSAMLMHQIKKIKVLLLQNLRKDFLKSFKLYPNKGGFMPDN